jgi:preprotein translocase subunit YajC
LYFDLNQVDSAFFYASSSFKFLTDIRTKQECYRIMANCKYLKGETKSMSVYMNKYVELGDSLLKINTQTKGSYIESMHSATREVTKTKHNLVYLLSVLLLVVIVAVVIYMKIIRRNKQEKQHAEATHAQQKVGIRKEVMFKHREALLEKIAKRRLEQVDERKHANVAERERIDLKMYEELLHLSDVQFFQKEMDTVLNNQVTKLKTRYPSVNDKEIHWCCLHLLGIPANDILLLLDYKVDSLKKMRQRLAAKLLLSSVNELNDFLNSLLSE